ncbi:SAM-dependent methyltransferase [Amycolatopsis umgeniensis]|uniref:Ubiquinone/menaquinone biosynthesis C-methylase UbiE n=1 Tax=Amycolatopsis umgeniensis TaxID=336628 RepID=A0A841AX88_9PSEU|nr:methyltransferase domain-containing protein [Amycolatopsis umgeniensis]MBB5851261.1 ubiquinone/menaquinone biosynthesis C-methylase UbiE [Amycolatopsis umgeniensis]
MITETTSQKAQAYYEQAEAMYVSLYGPNFHHGYWPLPDDGTTYEQALENLTDQIIDRVVAGPGDRVLDVGCGIGGPAIRLASRTGANVVGISNVATQIERASARASSENMAEQVRFEQADALELPFPDESFDAAIAIESLIHMDRGPALSEIARVLRPGGVLTAADFCLNAVVTPERQQVLDRYRDLDSLSPFHRFDEFPPMLRRAGLEPLELLDASTHVEKSVKMWWERTEADLENLTNHYGKQELTDFIGLFDDVINHGGPEYLIFTARKPLRP